MVKNVKNQKIKALFDYIEIMEQSAQDILDESAIIKTILSEKSDIPCQGCPKGTCEALDNGKMI